MAESNVLERGIEAARAATAADNAGDYDKALDMYLTAVKFLLHVVKYGPESQREPIKRRVEGYLGRAEQIKQARNAGDKPKAKIEAPPPEDLENFDLRAELEKRVGMDDVKRKLLAFEHGQILDARRRELSREVKAAPFPHCLFKGPPGSGKTSMARLVAKSLAKLGVLETGHLIEVQRSDLVAGHIGQTAIKTRAVIDKAKGGVLFVDECYRLAGRGDNDFGPEAIDELMAAMEAGDPIIIFAGYDDIHMDDFVKSNPGLFRRIQYVFTFTNYSPRELAQILLLKIDTHGFKLAPPLDKNPDSIAALLVNHTTQDQRHRMNGGLCDALLRHAKTHLDARLTVDSNVDALLTYTPDDLIRACADLPTPPPLDAGPPPPTRR
ncbi:hypothetical protein CTAYLR_004526 [Chrysophaeum taylorii]|uniref:AAA+ ATPase domain-containing protein n=1 Tax=Chrysophaeum taylorii TaxID=2483200 RepID=A0AAD7UMX7_9STRA|nr:hypothetical protein CTAYLR_004526 [Chrysophaeum taylorii]